MSICCVTHVIKGHSPEGGVGRTAVGSERKVVRSTLLETPNKTETDANFFRINQFASTLVTSGVSRTPSNEPISYYTSNSCKFEVFPLRISYTNGEIKRLDGKPAIDISIQTLCKHFQFSSGASHFS